MLSPAVQPEPVTAKTRLPAARFWAVVVSEAATDGRSASALRGTTTTAAPWTRAWSPTDSAIP